MMTKLSVFRGLFLFTATLTIAGCGSGTVSVKGVVTLDGVPLPKAAVSFVPLGEGRPAYGQTDANGNFRLTTFKADDGVLPGEYKVLVAEEGEGKQDPKTFTDEDRKQARMGMKPKSGMPPVAVGGTADKKTKKPGLVPAKYGDLKNTPLRETVPPSGKIEIALTSKSSG